MKPVLAIVHLYYPEMWSELKDYLNNIKVPYDLYVTTVDNNKYLEDDILKFKSDAHFEIVENRGYDVAPFVHVINKVNLEDYSYVVKLHTKRDMPIGSKVNGYNCNCSKWRNWALSFLKVGNFEKCLKSFENNKELGMISNFHLIVRKSDKSNKEVEKKAKDLLGKVGLNFISYSFVAGTMFMCRASLLKVLQKLEFKITDFEIPDKKHTSGLAHVLERFIGYAVSSQNNVLDDVYTFRYYQKACVFLRPFKGLLHFFYTKKINKSGFLVIRIFRIPIFTRRNYNV